MKERAKGPDIKAEKITKPIQLLAASLAGVIFLSGEFLFAAYFLEDWQSLLVPVGVAVLPVFLVSLFIVLVTRRHILLSDETYKDYRQAERLYKEKKGQLQDLAEGFADIVSELVADANRVQDERTLHVEMIAARDRIAGLLSKFGSKTDRISQAVSPIDDMLERDLLSEALRPTASTSRGEVENLFDLAKEGVRNSRPGTAASIARSLLEPKELWDDTIERAIEKYEQFRRSGRWVPEEPGQNGVR